MIVEDSVAASTTAAVSAPEPLAAAHALAPAPASLEASLEAPNDATYGWEMFVAFVAAVVGISIVVAVLALIGSWVMLGIAMAVHVGVTATMMKLVLGAFGSEDHAYPDMHRAEAASRAAISSRRNSGRGARPQLAV